MPVTHPEYLLKGTWFVTSRRYLAERHGEAVLQQVIDRMAPEHGAILADPLASEWYPEDASLDMLTVFLEHLCNRNPERYDALIEESTTFGIGRFFRVLLKLGTPGFILKQAPTFWKQLRRGPGTMTVQAEGKVHRVRYAQFPFLRYDAYRLCFPAQLRALGSVSASSPPAVTVVTVDDNSITLEVRVSG
jgi:hypothetical protein